MPELKRLHGFPDDYEFAGSRRDIQLQIGNAVPPPLAEVIGAAIRTQMTGPTRAIPLQRALSIAHA